MRPIIPLLISAVLATVAFAEERAMLPTQISAPSADDPWTGFFPLYYDPAPCEQPKTRRRAICQEDWDGAIACE